MPWEIGKSIDKNKVQFDEISNEIDIKSRDP